MMTHIDHLVLTVQSIEKTCDFYEHALGFERETMPNGRTVLRFGRCKINLHQANHTFEPKAASPTPGSADFCMITHSPLDEVASKILAAGFEPELGPVQRMGAMGTMDSIYVRDPDANLVEIGHYRERPL